MRNIVLSILLLLPFGVNAYQRIPVQDGIEVSANISSTGLNRIAIENDKITGIKGTAGEFEYDKDTENGQIFIKPIEVKDKPIYVFLTSESGNTYSLSLTTSEVSPENIILVPVDKPKPTNGEQSTSYESTLKQLISAMHTQSSIEGYAIEGVKVRLPKIQNAKVTHVQSYMNSKLQGEILEVTNNSSESINLAELEFYYDGVRAVAIVDRVLEAKQSTRVYVVRS